MRQRSRLVELWLIAAAFAVVSTSLWGAGRIFDEPLLSFAGLMTIASTFLPMPADAYVVNVSQHVDPVTVGLLGGAINAVAVLGERVFLDRLIGYPAFERLRKFVDSNRLVDATEKHMFLGLLIGGATPLPFEVFRFVACVRNYSLWRFALATFIGRGSRFYVLATAGSFLAAHDLLPWVVWSLVALFVAGLVKSVLRLRRLENHEQGAVDST